MATGYGAPPQQPGYGAPPQQPGYGAPPQQYGAQQPGKNRYGAIPWFLRSIFCDPRSMSGPI